MKERYWTLAELSNVEKPIDCLIYNWRCLTARNVFISLIEKELGDAFTIEVKEFAEERDIVDESSQEWKLLLLGLPDNTEREQLFHAIKQRGEKATRVDKVASPHNEETLFFITLLASTKSLKNVLENPVYEIGIHLAFAEDANKSTNSLMLQLRNISIFESVITAFLDKKLICYEFFYVPRNSQGVPKKTMEMVNGHKTFYNYCFVYFTRHDHRVAALTKTAGHVVGRFAVYVKDTYQREERKAGGGRAKP